MPELDEPPVGLVGRLLNGPEAGFYVEVDDDTTRPGGSGGYYILTWTSEKSYDSWLQTWEDVVFSCGSSGSRGQRDLQSTDAEVDH